MEYGFSIIMFCLAAGILIYALIICVGGYGLIPRGDYSAPDDKKAYAVRFAKILAIVSIAPAVSGIIGLFGGHIIASLIVLIAGFVCLLAAGVKFLK